MLTSKTVEDIFTDCLFKDEEIVDGKPNSTPIMARAIMVNAGFNFERISKHAQRINYLLEFLPEKFMEGTGGGGSFLNACNDKDGNQWGEHTNVDKLIALGIAINRVEFTTPRETWHVLPGGMPYFMVKKNRSARSSI